MENNKYISKLNEIDKKVENAKSNKDDMVTVISVTKTRHVDEINKAIEAGATDIGENKVQEIRDKYDSVLPVKWHMIGHLQSNKVKYIIDKVNMIHSIDSMKLAKEVSKQAIKHDLKMDVLVQVNVAQEESKFGIEAIEARGFIEQIAQLDNICIKGLMVIAPLDEPEHVRKYFKEGKLLFEDLKTVAHPNIDMQYLSMGMTNDYEVAIEEGSNMVRIGTAIFGDRNY